MLITCFQCRQPMDVPDDSACKRVRCPQCHHVIVVPGLAKAVDASPAIALPLLELDEPTDKLAAPPPPSSWDPPACRTEATPSKRVPLAEDDVPPSIERGARRRPPVRATPPKKTPGRGFLIAGVGIVTILVCLALASDSFRSKKRRAQPPVKIAIKGGPQPVVKAREMFPPQPPAFQPQPPAPVIKWKEFTNAEHRFKVQFPGPPVQRQQVIQRLAATEFEVRQGLQVWSVAHSTLTDKEFGAGRLADRFDQMELAFCDMRNGLRTSLIDLRWKDSHPAREWTIAHGDRIDHIRCFFVRDGKRYHQFVLTASGTNITPRRDYNRFFDSFGVLLDLSAPGRDIGQTIHEITDDLSKEGARTNEYTSLALHPTKPLAVMGTMQARVKAVWVNGEQIAKPIVPHETQPIDQLSISQDGRWLAVAVGGKIQLWLDWDSDLPNKKRMIPGLRGVFTKEHRLLVMSKDSIREYDPHTDKYLASTAVQDEGLEGFALSPDGSLLAMHAGKTILLWDRAERRLLARLEGHDASVTHVAFAPNGRTLASASADRTIRLWDVETNATRATLRQHAWTVWRLAFAPDGKHLASAGLDGMLLVWDLRPPDPRLIWAQAQQYPVRSVAWGRDGKNLYFTCKHPGRLDQAAAGRQFVRELRRVSWNDVRPNPVEAEKIVAQRAGLHLASVDWLLSFTPDCRTIVTTTKATHNVSEPRQVRLWDAASAHVRFAEPAMNGGALSPDGKWFVFARPGAKVVLRILEVEGNLVLADRAELAANVFPFVFYTPDSSSLWVLQKNELLRFSLPALVLKQRLQLAEPADERVIKIIPSHDRLSFAVERLAAGSGLRERTLHRASDGAEIPLTALPAGIGSAFWRLRQSDSRQIELEDLLQGTSRVVGQQRFKLAQAAIHPDGRIGATGDSANELALRINFWDLQEHRPILTLPDVSARTATALQFSPDGRLVAVTTTGGWTRIVPMDWLLQRQGLLPGNVQEVGAP